MSATPNNVAPGWEHARTLTPARETKEADGRNALQGLLAFACVHQQAARRKREAGQGSSDSSPRLAREEELALDEILQLVAARAIAITGADGVAIALAKDRAIVCRASAGKIAPDPGVRLDPNLGFSGACLRNGEIVRCDDSENDVRVDPKACRALGTRSMIAVPLSAKKRVIGLLEAFSSETYGFNDSDVRSLNLLGELILAAIRPEEEHHLAEMAREVLPDVPAEATPRTSMTADEAAPAASIPIPAAAVPVPAATLVPPVAPAIPVAAAPAAKPAISAQAVPAIVAPVASKPPSSKILVDEQFAPKPAVASAEPPVLEKPLLPREVPVLKPPTIEDAAHQAPREPAKLNAGAVAPARPVPAAPVLAPVEKVEFGTAEPYLASTEGAGEQRSFLSVTLMATAVLVAIGFAGVLVWKWQNSGSSISASTHAGVQARAGDKLNENAEPGTLAPPLKIGAMVQVMGIHHTTSADSSNVVVDLEDQVQYEEHTLDNPPRIYFDLHDTKLSAALANQTISVDDAFLKRIRVAQPVEGITRVVLETKNAVGVPEPLVSLDNDPYRLTIQFKKQAVAPSVSVPAVKPAPVLPKPSPVVGAKPGKPLASSDASAAGSGFEIALDAGHGGWDLGTVGKKGLLEKDLVLDVVQRLGDLLESRLGATVVYTRQEDAFMSLEKRAEIANLAHADLFLSVHANYSDLSTARGVETYYTNTYSSVKARTPDVASLQAVNWSGVVDIRAKVKGARQLASDIQQALYGGLASRNPDIRNRGVKEAQYVVLTGTQMPAVLAEVSFVSSPADEDRLKSAEYRQFIAEALYKGVAKYRDETQRTRMASAQKAGR